MSEEQLDYEALDKELDAILLDASGLMKDTPPGSTACKPCAGRSTTPTTLAHWLTINGRRSSPAAPRSNTPSMETDMTKKTTWRGGCPNPFEAYLACANANNIDTTEVTQFILAGWLMRFDLSKKAAQLSLLDDLLRELASYTNIIVQQREDGDWWAALEK